MASRTQSPFSGFPVTNRTIDISGSSEFRIAPLALTPQRAKLADLLGRAIVIGLILEGLLYLGTLGPLGDQPGNQISGWYWLAVIVVPTLLHPVFRVFFRAILAKRSRIVITANIITARRLCGTKNYDRRLPHRFTLLPHDKAPAEKIRHNLEAQQAQMARKIIYKTPYYGESWHLSLEYLGQRNDLLTVYGRKKALAILARLKACDEVVDGEMKKGQGVPLEPKDEWGEQPGEIPQNDK